MVKKISIFAIMASVAMAAPTLGIFGDGASLGFGLFGGGQKSASMSASAGFTAGVAGALEGCAGGATSGSIDQSWKAELGVWIKGSGKNFFDAITCKQISDWCGGESTHKIEGWARTAMSIKFGADSTFYAAGGAFPFFNALIEKSHNGGACACKSVEKGHQSSLSSFLKGSAGASIEAGIYGSLDTCASGGIAASLSVSAQNSLSAWLSSEKCSLKGDLLLAVKRWVSVGGKISGGVSGGIGAGIGGEIGGGGGVSAGVDVILGGSLQTSLGDFCGGSVFGGLDLEVQAGLKACAAGGVAGSLSGAIQTSLSAFIKSPNCPLDAGLKGSIGLWLGGQIGAGVEVGTSLDAFAYIAGGVDILGNFNIDNTITVEAQASLSSFCKGPGASIDAGVLVSLNICASGGVATSLEVSASAALSAFIASPDCKLDSKLRGTVLAWLSAGVSGSGGVGVGIGGGAGIKFDAGALVSIGAGIKGSTQISSTVKGALGVCLVGGVSGSVSFDARAELGAFLCSDAGVSLGAEVQGELFGWLSGCGSPKH